MGIKDFIQKYSSIASLVGMLSLSNCGSGSSSSEKCEYQPGFFTACQSSSCCSGLESCVEDFREKDFSCTAQVDYYGECVQEQDQCLQETRQRCSAQSKNGYPSCVDITIQILNAQELQVDSPYFQVTPMIQLLRSAEFSEEVIERSSSGKFEEVQTKTDYGGARFVGEVQKTFRTSLYYKRHPAAEECEERMVNPQYQEKLDDGSCQIRRFSSCDKESYIECSFTYDRMLPVEVQPGQKKYETVLYADPGHWKSLGQKVFCHDRRNNKGEQFCFPPFEL